MFEMKLPAEIMTVLSRLNAYGFQSCVVGGCVRDALRGIEPNDFDVATDAKPQDILGAFDGFKTIDTGLVHGTVIVVVDGKNIEITTFRVDGEYRDNRHPSEVRFTKELAEDLSRRDFTVNAMAYSPETGLADFFDGTRDIGRKIIRCVGDPDKRFNEDGLRILRALRFSSVLGFGIERETAEAIHRNRFLLKNISAERIYAELVKLLCGVGAGNTVADYCDVLSVFIPELASVAETGQLGHTAAVIDSVQPEKNLRLAALLHCAGGGHGGGECDEICDGVMRRLKADNATRKNVRTLALYCGDELKADEVFLKRLISKTSVEAAEALVKLKYACLRSQTNNDAATATAEAGRLIEKLRSNGACVSLKGLAVNGDDLMAAGIGEGRAVGGVLQILYDAVLDGRLPNDREALLAEAARLKESYRL